LLESGASLPPHRVAVASEGGRRAERTSAETGRRTGRGSGAAAAGAAAVLARGRLSGTLSSSRSGWTVAAHRHSSQTELPRRNDRSRSARDGLWVSRAGLRFLEPTGASDYRDALER